MEKRYRKYSLSINGTTSIRGITTEVPHTDRDTRIDLYIHTIEI